MAYTKELTCPYDDCGASLTVGVNHDSDYGSDYDGHRGIRRTTLEIIEQACEHNISDEVLERMME